MNSKLEELKKRRTEIAEEFQQIKTEEKKWLDEKEKIKVQLDEIEKMLDVSGPIMSLEEFEAAETKQRFLLNHADRVSEKIYELQGKRSDLVVSRSLLGN